MKERFRLDLYEANARSLNISNDYKKYEVPRVYKAMMADYGEKCYMDWDKQELTGKSTSNPRSLWMIALLLTRIACDCSTGHARDPGKTP